jgi:hypothetical protein
MDVFGLRDRLASDYGDFVRSFIHIRDNQILKKINEELKAGLISPDPWIQLNPSFEPGIWIDELVNSNTLLHI